MVEWRSAIFNNFGAEGHGFNPHISQIFFIYFKYDGNQFQIPFPVSKFLQLSGPSEFSVPRKNVTIYVATTYYGDPIDAEMAFLTCPELKVGRRKKNFRKISQFSEIL